MVKFVAYQSISSPCHAPSVLRVRIWRNIMNLEHFLALRASFVAKLLDLTPRQTATTTNTAFCSEGPFLPHSGAAAKARAEQRRRTRTSPSSTRQQSARRVEAPTPSLSQATPPKRSTQHKKAIDV